MPVTRVTSVRAIPRRDDVYEFLRSRGHADLFVDVGAASGEVTELIAPHASHVLAFEPFPPNVRLFKKRLASRPNVGLVEKAVSSRRGRTTFFVGSSVQGDEPGGWSDQVGYSSVGKIAPSRIRGLLSNFLRVGAATLGRRRGATMLRVETTTLDAELGGRTVDFLKVDVQGAEREVLEGARSAVAAQRIRLMYLEWSGDPAVEERLASSGYSIFDSVYVGSGNAQAKREFEDNGFEIIGTIPLSVGRPAFEMAYRGSNPDVGSILRKLNRRDQWIQTDLVALPERDKASYLEFLTTA